MIIYRNSQLIIQSGYQPPPLPPPHLNLSVLLLPVKIICNVLKSLLNVIRPESIKFTHPLLSGLKSALNLLVI